MALKDMYKGMINSPETTITSSITSSGNTITVADISVIPTGINILTLGGDTQDPETVRVTSISGSNLTVSRGFQGTAKTWPIGTKISRNFTEYDHSAFIDNILDLYSIKANADQLLTNVPLGAKFTDTVTTINSKTGVITKADIVALGIPSENTNTVTTINGKTGAISKADITALGIPGQDTNTTYSMATGSNDGLMSLTDKTKLDTIAPNADVSKVTKVAGREGNVVLTNTDVGLGDVTNDKQMPISGGILENYREKLVNLSGTSTAINLSLGNVFTHTLSGNTTYSMTNAVSGQAHSFTLIITQTATVRTLTFPPFVKWESAQVPDLTKASKSYILTFVTVNGGTTWLGMFGGEF